jgi:hypothetical protein
MKQKFWTKKIFLSFLFLIAFAFFAKNVKAADCSTVTNGYCTIQEYQNDCSPSSSTTPSSIFGQPGWCRYSYYRVHTYAIVMSGGVEELRTEIGSPGVCVTDPSSVACQVYPQYLTGCNVDADCATTDPCNVGTCDGNYNFNRVVQCIPPVTPYPGQNACYLFTAIKTCRITNICTPPSGAYCGNSVCDPGESNGTCPQDCPPPNSCPASPGQPTLYINNDAYEFRGAQGDVIPVTYTVANSGGSIYNVQESFSCPVSSFCNGTSTSPQIFNNPPDPIDHYSYSVRTSILGSQIVSQSAQGTASDNRCQNPNFNGSANIYAYRGDPYNVNTSASLVCGAVVVRWDKYNYDDLFNVYRAPASGGAPTLLASNIPVNNYSDRSGTIGTRYFYYVQIANRNTGAGEPVGNLIAANENYAPTNGMASIACPSVELTANPVSVATGNSSNLTWTVSNASSCSSIGADSMPAGNWTSAGNSTNISTGALSSNKTYQLRCTGNGFTIDSAPASVTVTASPTCPAASVVLTPSSRTVGQTATASAAGFTGGIYVSSNTGVATVSGSTINAVSLGTSSITGTGWNYSNGATNCSLTGSTFTVSSTAPSISVSPGSFTFGAPAGGSAPGGQTLTITNPVAGSTLNWRAQTNQTWCRVNGTNSTGSVTGTATSVTPATITVSVDSISLAGINSCTVTVSDNGSSPAATGGSKTANVTYTTTSGDTCTGAGCGTCSGGLCGGGPTNAVNANTSVCPAVSGVVLTWVAGVGATSYNIYRNTHGGAPVLLASNIGNVLTYADTTGTIGTKYDYWVESTGGGQTSINKVAANTNSGVGVSSSYCTPSAPTGGGGNNYSTSGGTVLCGRVRLNWTDNANNEAGFYVYRTLTNSAPVLGGASSPAYLATVGASASTGGTVTYNYAPTPAGTLYYYWVTAYVSTLESSPVLAIGSLADNPCVPDTSDSDKDITKVNGTPIVYSSGAPSPCNGQTQPLPSTINLRKDDILTFRINVCNDNGLASTTSIIITDRMINLSVPSGGWNIKYNGVVLSTAGGSFTNDLSNPTSPILTINLGSNQIAAGGSGYITFDAKLSIPAAFTAQSARFQNNFTIASNAPSTDGSTPLLPFYTGKGNSTIIEVP